MRKYNVHSIVQIYLDIYSDVFFPQQLKVYVPFNEKEKYISYFIKLGMVNANFFFKKKLRKKKLCHIRLPCNLKRTTYDTPYKIHFN